MALMEDERLILRWLSQYGPLRWPQIRGLLYYRPQRSVNRLVQNMNQFRNGHRCPVCHDGRCTAALSALLLQCRRQHGTHRSLRRT